MKKLFLFMLMGMFMISLASAVSFNYTGALQTSPNATDTTNDNPYYPVYTGSWSGIGFSDLNYIFDGNPSTIGAGATTNNQNYIYVNYSLPKTADSGNVRVRTGSFSSTYAYVYYDKNNESDGFIQTRVMYYCDADCVGAGSILNVSVLDGGTWRYGDNVIPGDTPFREYYGYWAGSAQIWNSNTTEGTKESFLVYMNYDSSEFTTVLPYLVYNGTYNSATNITGSGDNLEIQLNHFVPVVTTPTNYTFYWSVNLTNSTGIFTFNSREWQQTVNPFYVDSCSVYSKPLFNYSLVDEETQTLLSGTGDLTNISNDIRVYSSNGEELVYRYSTTENEVNYVDICTSDNFEELTEYSIYSTTQYQGEDYSLEYHNIQNLTVDNDTSQQNITLYDLLSADTTNFKIIYKGTNFLPVPDAIIKVQRQYVGEGVFKEVESPLTGTDGSVVAHLVRDDVNYNFVVSKNGIILATFENQVAFCEDIISENCIISLNALSGSGSIFNYENVVKIIHSITFNTTSRELNLLFSTFDGTSKTVNFKAYKNDQLGNNSICDTSLTASSGSLSCTVPASIGNETIYYELYVDSELVYTGFYALENPVDYGDTGIFLLLIFLLTIPLMFVDSKDLTIFAVGFVFIIAILYGFITGDIIGTSSAVIWLIIQGVILIVKNNTGGSING